MSQEDIRLIPVIDRQKCDACEECIEVCPPQAIVILDDTAVIKEEICEECGECVPVCPEEAISLPWE